MFRDFAPITLIATFSNLLVVNADVAAKSVPELIALAKAKPGTLTYGSPGTGSQPHLGGEFLRLLAGIEIVHVPYNGTAPALRDLLGGQITFMFAQTSAALPQVQAGKLRALGVASTQRATQLPDVPTIAEGGLSGFEAVSWYALLAPAGTPKEIASWRREVAELYAGMRNTAQRDPKLAAAQFRAGRDSLILHHPESPFTHDISAATQGIDYFPCEPAWRLTGHIERAVDRYRLQIDLADDGVLRCAGADPSGDTMLLDFNFAYNPSCAYDHRWSCPLSPPENRLPLSVPAGERAYRAP